MCSIKVQKGQKIKVGIKAIWDHWEESGNKGVAILHKQGFKRGEGLGIKRTPVFKKKKPGRDFDYKLSPLSFPLPVEIYRLRPPPPTHAHTVSERNESAFSDFDSFVSGVGADVVLIVLQLES